MPIIANFLDIEITVAAWPPDSITRALIDIIGNKVIASLRQALRQAQDALRTQPE